MDAHWMLLALALLSAASATAALVHAHKPVPPLWRVGSAVASELTVLVGLTGALLLVVIVTLTPALEQMNPQSDFIRTLNESDDPNVPYTILAGDIDRYREASDPAVGRLIAKAGRGLLFDALFAQKANDIAVGVDSILTLGTRRTTAAARSNVDCHHLNYFASQTGRDALRTVSWRLTDDAVAS